MSGNVDLHNVWHKAWHVLASRASDTSLAPVTSVVSLQLILQQAGNWMLSLKSSVRLYCVFVTRCEYTSRNQSSLDYPLVTSTFLQCADNLISLNKRDCRYASVRYGGGNSFIPWRRVRHCSGQEDEWHTVNLYTVKCYFSFVFTKLSSLSLELADGQGIGKPPSVCVLRNVNTHIIAVQLMYCVTGSTSVSITSRLCGCADDLLHTGLDAVFMASAASWYLLLIVFHTVVT